MSERRRGKLRVATLDGHGIVTDIDAIEVLPGDSIPQPLVDSGGRPLTQGAVNHLIAELNHERLARHQLVEPARAAANALTMACDLFEPDNLTMQSYLREWTQKLKALREALNETNYDSEPSGSTLNPKGNL